MKKYALVIAVALLVAVALYVYRSGVGPTPVAQAPTPGDALEVSAAQVLETTPLLSDAAPPAPHPPTSLSVAFNTQADLKALADSLRARARGGDAQATYYIGRILEYCYAYAMNPANYQRDTEVLGSNEAVHPDVAAVMRHYRDLNQSRCQGYGTQAQRIGLNDIVETLRTAAQQGSLAAEAMLLVLRKPISTQPDYPSEVINRALAARDPDAYLSVSMIIPVDTNPENFSLQGRAASLSGSHYASWAWQLAACRIGLDCSRQSVVMTQYCANGGICGNFNTLEDLIYQSQVTQAEAWRVKAVLQKILTGEHTL